MLKTLGTFQIFLLQLLHEASIRDCGVYNGLSVHYNEVSFLVCLVELITERLLYLCPHDLSPMKTRSSLKLSPEDIWVEKLGRNACKFCKRRAVIWRPSSGAFLWGCHCHMKIQINPLGIGWPKVCCLYLGVVVFWKTYAHDRKAMRSGGLSSGSYDQL